MSIEDLSALSYCVAGAIKPLQLELFIPHNSMSSVQTKQVLYPRGVLFQIGRYREVIIIPYLLFTNYSDIYLFSI